MATSSQSTPVEFARKSRGMRWRLHVPFLFVITVQLLLSPAASFVVSGVSRKHQVVKRVLPASLASQATPTIQEDNSVDDANSSTSPLETNTKGALSMTVDELAVVLGGWGRARLAWDCYSIGIDPQIYFGQEDSMTKEERAEIQNLLPTCRNTQTMGRDALERLSGLYGECQVESGVATLVYVSRSGDDTTKLLLRLQDGLEVETVIIPWNGVRSTLCISSQVGCRQGCTFCATGRMGRLRSLTSDEILAQMFFARKFCRMEDLPDVTNVVFMGMGEPADNVHAVVTAAKILTNRNLFQLSASKVTISTVAPTPESFSDLAQAPCVLAWSVHAVDDDLRRKLVPTTRYSMHELREGFIQALLSQPQHHKRTAMLEVALMAGVNDGLQQADELAEFSQVIQNSVPGCKLVVNLIPYNPAGNKDIFSKPNKETVRAFQERLWQQGVYAHIRTTRGDDEDSACGQLATLSRRKQSATTIQG